MVHEMCWKLTLNPLVRNPKQTFGKSEYPNYPVNGKIHKRVGSIKILDESFKSSDIHRR